MAYGFPANIASNWHHLMTTFADYSSYINESQSFFYSKLAGALVLDPNDMLNSKCWSGLAFMAYLFEDKIKDSDWFLKCKRLFDG